MPNIGKPTSHARNAVDFCANLWANPEWANRSAINWLTDRLAWPASAQSKHALTPYLYQILQFQPTWEQNVLIWRIICLFGTWNFSWLLQETNYFGWNTCKIHLCRFVYTFDYAYILSHTMKRENNWRHDNQMMMRSTALIKPRLYFFCDSGIIIILTAKLVNDDLH